MRFRNITIGRYDTPVPEVKTIPGVTPEDTVYTEGTPYGGWIEGVRDDGTTWILFLDENANPKLFWGNCETGGGVIGEPINLSPEPDTPSMVANQ